jgi:carbonic anhydrase/acetyltransferase-like protein (isoleucine patch superfamily)
MTVAHSGKYPTISESAFIATGAAIFHGAKLCKGSEVRINGQPMMPEIMEMMTSSLKSHKDDAVIE